MSMIASRVSVLVLMLLGLALPASAAAPDLFTVPGIKVEATADSATAARDLAMKQGRPEAWTKLYHALTPPSAWPKQPMLDDNALLHLIRTFEVSNERRSTTRYLAEVTYHFIPDAVRQVLRRSNVAYAETQSKPALVIPIVGKGRFDPNSKWAQAFNDPGISQGLAPLVLPAGDGADLGILSRPDLDKLDWAALAPLVRRYGPTEIVIAAVSDDAKSMQVTEITPAGKQGASFAFAQSTFEADAQAVADKVSESWKAKSAVDYALRARLTADVEFNSPQEWARVRAQLAAVRSVSDIDVVGLAQNEAQIDVAYFGRMEQLRDAMAQQNLDLIASGGQYTLQLGANAASNSP